MLKNFTNMLRNDAGQGLVEYALIIALVSIVAITALQFLGKKASNTLNNAAGTDGRCKTPSHTPSTVRLVARATADTPMNRAKRALAFLRSQPRTPAVIPFCASTTKFLQDG